MGTKAMQGRQGDIREQPRRRSVPVAAAIVLVVGVLASLLGASWWRSSVVADREREFESSAANIAASLRTLLSRDGDLVATARTLVVTQPAISSEAFEGWFRTMGAGERYPGLFGFGAIRRVVAEGFGSDGPLRWNGEALESGEGPLFLPAERRDSYCVLQAIVALENAEGRVPGTALSEVLSAAPRAVDYCQGESITAVLNEAAREGEPVAINFTTLAGPDSQRVVDRFADGSDPIFYFFPVYYGGAVPPTVDARRVALWGWVGGMFDVKTVIAEAVAGEPGIGVSLYRVGDDGSRTELGRYDRAGEPGMARTIPMQADGRWLVRVESSADPAGPSSTSQYLGVLAAGLTVTGLLFALILVLGRSRARALRMVSEKTVELRHQALHDALTGLPNRALALDRTEQMLARSRRSRDPVAALFVDLDGFKDINDSLGHSAGDEVLMVVAARLRGAVREADTVARLGGDEFVILVEGDSLTDGPEIVAQRVLDSLVEPILLDLDAVGPLSVSASIGIASGPRLTAEELLRDADIALYQAKAAGKARYALFQRAMQQAVQSRIELEADVRNALDAGQFFLVYQPTFDLTQVQVTGVEALLRWRHPVRGVVPPLDFIPFLEESGAILEVGRWVLAEACRQVKAWHRLGYPISLAVNISARQIESERLVADVGEALAAEGLSPEFLVLEITETVLVNDSPQVHSQLAALKELGVRIAIDDFGTGYSSLAYLQRFPVDSLKIDRSFVSGNPESPESAALLHTLVQLGKNLGLETFAEGIEERSQLDRLQAEGCDSGQGFLLARPLESADLEAFLVTSGDRSLR